VCGRSKKKALFACLGWTRSATTAHCLGKQVLCGYNRERNETEMLGSELTLPVDIDYCRLHPGGVAFTWLLRSRQPSLPCTIGNEAFSSIMPPPQPRIRWTADGTRGAPSKEAYSGARHRATIEKRKKKVSKQPFSRLIACSSPRFYGFHILPPVLPAADHEFFPLRPTPSSSTRDPSEHAGSGDDDGAFKIPGSLISLLPLFAWFARSRRQPVSQPPDSRIKVPHIKVRVFERTAEDSVPSRATGKNAQEKRIIARMW
jgi:hypothetical protein